MQSFAVSHWARFAGVLILLTAPAWAQCNNPSSPGVVICTPTNNSTVAYIPTISVRSTPAQGASISAFKIYDNNVRIYQSSPGQTGIDLADGGMYNGSHYVVVNAWDSEGHLYQAKTTFTITGEGFGLCPIPSSPGVVICNPPTSAIFPTYASVDASARGQSAITNLSFYLNGKFVTSVPNSWGAGVPIQLSGQGIANTVKVVAKDSTGHTYSTSKTLTARYTYSGYSCGKNTCVPGIAINSPWSNQYVGNTFNVNAQILDNPRPITTMKAYLDNTLVATSSGPTLQHEVSSAPNGTHILTIQGWDTAGIEYRLQENININVHE